MQKAFLFDIGNVIIRFDFRKTIAALQDEMEAAPASALAMVSDLTHSLEMGDIQPEQFIERAGERVGYRGTPEKFRNAFEDVFTLNEPIVEFIEFRAEEGADLFLLSNTNGIHVPFFTKEYPVFSLFQQAIYSHEVKCMKPDPAIFQLAIEKLGLVPQETVYIDDSAANCEAGREAGLIAIEYSADDHGRFLKDYEALN